MSAKRTAILNHAHGKQRGAALLIMLVILVVGAAAVLINSLTSSTVKIARQETTAAALAQAKDALIGYAASDATRPGELPCPDVNDDGKLTMNVDYIGSNCVSPIGRLPWKTLGLPELRDGAGEHLWYTVSKTFWANGSVPINSDTQGNLTVSGTTAASNVIAIVFAPGNALSGQSRSSTNQVACATNGLTVAESWCATNYLEGTNPAPNPQVTPNLNYQSANTSSTFNDRLMIISTRDLIPPVEKRVAKEVQGFLASYRAANGGVYPYPATFTNCTFNSANPINSNCDSSQTQCRGRLPLHSDVLSYPDWANTLPAWFVNNGWFNVIYYSAGTNRLNPSPVGCNPNLTVSGAPTPALFFMPGSPLGNITRPSNNLPDYLEDAENQNMDDTYVQPGSTAISNDSLYILP